MSAKLARLKNGYTTGGRGLGMRLMGRFESLPVTPNQLTVAGLSLNGVAAVLIYQRYYGWAFVAFLAGSVFDILDGALARSHGKLTPFGGFLDSTTDRISEGLILGSIALVLSAEGDTWALASVFVALVGSFLVSYTRAKAEAIGLKCEVGLMTRTERIVLVAVALPFAGYGSLPYAMYLLAALTAFTVWQRIDFVRRSLATSQPEV
jgi:CDP-diacylglycerol---glycerol-3-phosphate 3-phosphatidyltransferase